MRCDSPRYSSLPELLEQREFRDRGWGLRMWPLSILHGEALRLDCECEACGAHGEPIPAAAGLEMRGARLVCRPCVAAGHDTPTRIDQGPAR